MTKQERWLWEVSGTRFGKPYAVKVRAGNYNEAVRIGSTRHLLCVNGCALTQPAESVSAERAKAIAAWKFFSFPLPAGRRNSLPHIARDAGIKVTARLVAKGQVRVWRVK